jgi:hypothetical protein
MLMPTKEIKVNKSNPPSFTTPFAKAIDTWMYKNKPNKKGKPQINMKLQVFGMSGLKHPLIVIDNMYLDMDS